MEGDPIDTPVAIITGAGSGIGAAVARRLAKPDVCLVLHGQGRDAAGVSRLQDVTRECERRGAKVAYSTASRATVMANTYADPSRDARA